MQLTIWTVLATIFGAGVIFLLGMWVGFRLAVKGVTMAIEDSSMDRVLRYKNLRFVAVVDGGKAPSSK